MKTWALLLAATMIVACGQDDTRGRRSTDAGFNVGEGDAGGQGDAGGNEDGGTPDADSPDGSDGGTGEPDGGTGEPDGGTGEPDGGTGEPDSGTGEPDGGTGEPDGGTDPAPVCDASFGPDDACGGDIIGTWDFGNACTDFDLAGQLGQLCAGVTIESMDVQTDGTLVITADNFARAITIDVEAMVHVPFSCTFGLGCDMLTESAGAVDPNVEMTCELDASGQQCECAVSASYGEESAGAYTLEGGVLTAGEAVYDVCASGDTLTARRRADNAEEPSFVEIYTK
ncbi:hypothetical protein DL240_16555 [Lujinxingia litoralis]|uniref:Uncharacterized protein n=1 Tax=Lujinxingia litoralis TaxID=2211119 RepID=A0A328C3C0_9DELT|nr:hypothetical protein [Lujinxingia litoralis]RAL20415.1 hypothetical protein DL240_16555 [Lujinxingia litoralis]